MDATTVIEIAAVVVGAIFSLAALFAGVGYFRQGKNQSRIDANILLKDDVEALTKKVNLQATDIEKLTKEVQDLHRSIDEKDKKLSEYVDILRGRDPQMTLFLSVMQEYVKNNTPLLETIKSKTIPTIERLENYLNKQTF